MSLRYASEDGFVQIFPVISFRCRMTWATLIKCVNEVDPFKYPKCGGEMRIISFIEEDEVIRKILKHCGLWKEQAPRPPPEEKPPPEVEEPMLDYGLLSLRSVNAR